MPSGPIAALLAGILLAALGISTASHAGMIIATYQEASGETGILGTSSSGELTGGRFIGTPPNEFNPLAFAIRGQPDFFDDGVLFKEGLEASIFAIADRGYEGTLTVTVTYFDTLADPGTLNLSLAFEVKDLAPGWALTVEDYGDPNDFPFPGPTALLLGSETFATAGSATSVAAFDNPGGLFSLSTIFRITAPTPGLLTATARITAEQPIVAAPEPPSLAVVACALAGLAPWAARRRRPTITDVPPCG